MPDVLNLNYSEEELGTAIGSTMQALSQIKSGNATAAATAGLTARWRDCITRNCSAAGVSSGTIGAVASQWGIAANPFLTVVFKSPMFKRHVLSWKLTPANQADSTALSNICNAFRHHALPTIGGGGGLYNYPDIVLISMSNANDNYFFYEFKPCVIEQVSVNWAGAGQASFFNGTQAPVVVDLVLNLLEVELWTQTDVPAGG